MNIIKRKILDSNIKHMNGTINNPNEITPEMKNRTGNYLKL